MRAQRMIASTGVLVALLAACSKNQPVLPQVPAACILLKESQVRKETGDPTLKVVGSEAWNTLGGNTCTFEGSGRPPARWDFEIDPDSGSAKKRAAQTYELTQATKQQLAGADPVGTYVLSRDKKTVGLFTDISGGAAVTVTGSAEVSPSVAYRLAIAMSQANAAQGAAGVAGQ